MDGFVREAVAATHGCTDPNDPVCVAGGGGREVMGYHDAREIPNYWAYARNFVLQDHMFEPNASWSLPAHLLMVSAWSAKCKVKGDPMSCVDAPDLPDRPPDFKGNRKHTIPDYAWTDMTHLLHEAHVSWRYYVMKGTEPDCRDDAAITCAAIPQDAKTPGIWNPLPYFDTVRENWQLDNITSLRNFFTAAKAGKLPAVSWIAPAQKVSEHPPGLVSAGQAYVTTLINAVMRSPNWSSTAIFLAWDDWGGFYDHVVPPYVDQNELRASACRGSSSARTRSAATSTTRRSASTRTSSSSRTSSSTASASTRAPTAGPIRARTSARTCRSSATSRRTSTSTRRRGSRCCSIPCPRALRKK